MSATAHEHEPLTRENLLLEGFLALETPEGFRAELIEGEIVVTPPPDGAHEAVISRITRQLARRSAVDMDVSGNKGLRVPRGGPGLRNRVIPGLTFAEAHSGLFDDAEPWMPCDGVAMVVEVTSSGADRDRTIKRYCYARGGIPLYLLVDRERRSVTLFGEPGGEDYRQVSTVPYGKEIILPAPFSCELETGEFLQPGRLWGPVVAIGR
ncbi:Uma2 family endonuclease [Streptomyces zingiberis]|uniref:Uma2 family endonuclease n=1 Tax=Streptomyces zingiberis TaxID=2053010 RepID=A0ABX1BSW6_9ACTN|nr:Uma2 family endonuclease [Streptomyces zingiberis]NJP99644.1 Uma2 family endonuclease [Streptomyces zingiberis]